MLTQASAEKPADSWTLLLLWDKASLSNPSIPGTPGVTSQLTHLPVLHKEDVQRVQGAEVEDVNVVLHSHLETGALSQSLVLGSTSEAPGRAHSLCPHPSRRPHMPSLGAKPLCPLGSGLPGTSVAKGTTPQTQHFASTGQVPDPPPGSSSGVGVRVQTEVIGPAQNTPGGCSEAPSS